MVCYRCSLMLISIYSSWMDKVLTSLNCTSSNLSVRNVTSANRVTVSDKPCSTVAAYRCSLVDTNTQLLHHTDALFLVFGTRHPELFTVFHDLCQDGTSEEHHVLPARWILNADLEFLKTPTNLHILHWQNTTCKNATLVRFWILPEMLSTLNTLANPMILEISLETLGS